MRKAVIAITLSMIFISFTVFAAAKQVSFIDQLKCIKCGTCIKTCPVKAISKVKIDGKDSYIVDPAKCISCGACNKACPTKAIKLTGASLSLKDTTKVSKDTTAKTTKTAKK
jgi:ferredoxin